MAKFTTLIPRFITLILISLSISPAKAQDTYFPYPVVPDTINNLQQRCDFLVTHFWDRCDLKKAFSSRPKMNQSFADFISFMPYASAEKTHEAVDAFLKQLDKQPDDLLFIGQLAEDYLYGDSASFWSDELYLKFAQAVAENKKIDKDSKLRFARHVKILNNSMEGAKVADLAYTDINGMPRHLAADTAQVVLLFFSDPDCSDCTLARIRLDADIKARKYIEDGALKVVCLSANEPDDKWKAAVATYPSLWTVGTTPELDDTFDIRSTPSFYILDSKQTILAKNLGIEAVLQVLSRI